MKSFSIQAPVKQVQCSYASLPNFFLPQRSIFAVFPTCGSMANVSLQSLQILGEEEKHGENMRSCWVFSTSRITEVMLMKRQSKHEMLQYNLSPQLPQTIRNVHLLAEHLKSFLKEELPCLHPFLSCCENNWKGRRGMKTASSSCLCRHPQFLVIQN